MSWNEPLNFGEGDFVDEGNEFGFWTTEKQTNKPKKRIKRALNLISLSFYESLQDRATQKS